MKIIIIRALPFTRRREGRKPAAWPAFVTLLLLGAMLIASGVSVRAAFVPVDFSARFNRRLQDTAWGSVAMNPSLLNASGTTSLNGVPFNIPVNGNNFWHSYQPGPGAVPANPLDDNQPRVLSMSVNIPDARRIYTLMDTYWGAASPLTYVKLEAFGTGGAYVRFDLYGNVHFRDFNQNTWTNGLNQVPVGSQQVMTWSNFLVAGGTQRLDRQQFDLGSAFLGRTLTELRLTDAGGYFPGNPILSQRVFLAGATVETATTLTVTLNPPEAVGAGAQWQLDGGAWQNSGVKLAGLAAGNHTVNYKPVTGWTAPAALPLTLVAGAARNITATYTLAAGSLQTGINPPGAVTAGAQWQVDGGPWRNSGDTVSALSPGNHTVAFKAIAGWDVPDQQTVGVAIGSTTTVTGTYQAHPGSLQVTVGPAGAITEGAQWQVDGGGWFSSGETAASLAPGVHILAFKPLPLWNTPVSQSVTIASDSLTTATGIYTQVTGSLQVTINPAAAAAAGAQWQVDGGAFQNSGATLAGITVGAHALTFKTVSGWGTPAGQTVNIAANSTTAATGTYSTNPGSLQVTINPAGAVTAGAQWQVDGSAWQNSGTTLSGLSPGPHSVAFKGVNGWVTPAAQAVTITSDNTTTAAGTYTPGLGSLVVTIFPPEANTAGAQWRVDGGEWQNSGVTLTGFPSGTHTVSYKPVAGWIEPDIRVVDVVAGGTGGASGVYQPAKGTLTVTLQPAGAVAAGAQWTVDGVFPGFGYNSGASISGLSFGTHTVAFKPLSGWGTPPTQTITISSGATTQVTGTYTGAAGTLQVTLSPPGAGHAGAQWQLDGGPFQSSGATLSNIASGNHTIAFKRLARWTAPAAQTVTISTGTASAATGAYYPDCAAPGLVSWWKADDNALDMLGRNDAVLSGGPSFAAGAIDDAFQFDGVNDSAKVNASRSLDVGPGSGLTLAAWIYPTEVNGSHAIMEWNGGTGELGVHFYVSGAHPGSLYANVIDSGGGYHPLESAPGVILPNQWQHVALTYDRTSGLAVLYWNGVAVKQLVLGSFTPQTTYDLYLGKRQSSPGGEPPFWFAGGLDSVQVYDRALTPSETLLSSAECDAGGTANFYIASRNGGNTGLIYGYQVNTQAAVLTRVLNDSGHLYPFGLALSPQGELFVGSVSNNQNLRLPGFVRRYGEPYTVNDFAGQIGAGTLLQPHGLGFRGNELLAVDSGNNRVRRYSFATNGDPVEQTSITSGLVNYAARAVVASPDGSEVFVSQCYCGGVGGVRRYRAEANGTFTDLGALPGNFINPHIMAFSPWGEMFTANPDLIDGQSTNWFIARHTFAADGTPQFNGTFNDPHLKGPVSLTFTPWGELLVNNSTEASIIRFTFDASRRPVYHGTIPLPTVSGQMVFTDTSGQGTLNPVALDIFRAPAQNSYRLQWSANPGNLYRIEYSSDLQYWRGIPGTVQAASALENWTDPGPPATDMLPSLVPQRFYRLFELRQ